MVFGFKGKYLLLTFFLLLSVVCFSQRTSPVYMGGADRPEVYLPMLKNKKVAVVTNQTGILQSGEHLVDFLLRKKISLTKILTPEHGFRGNADAGEKVANSRDAKTGLPLISLYGNHKKPTAEDLAGTEVVVFDLQDVGTRFYTYISTLTYMMEACAEQNLQFIILDRPNPNDGMIDGPVLTQAFQSFVGLHPVPVLYGMTIGEYGRMVAGEGWLTAKNKIKLKVIPLKNYSRGYPYPLPVPPSPNLKTQTAVALYPGLCFFEGTEVSVGRGTAKPFEIFGSPYLPAAAYNFHFTPTPQTGAKNPPFLDQLCYGKDLSHAKFPNHLDITHLLSAYRDFTKLKEEFFLKNLFFDKLAGTDQLRKQIARGVSEAEIRRSWQKDLQNFKEIRKKYLLYHDAVKQKNLKRQIISQPVL